MGQNLPLDSVRREIDRTRYHSNYRDTSILLRSTLANKRSIQAQ